MVYIEFSSIVSFEQDLIGDDISVQLRYDLFRARGNKRPIVVGTWTVDVFRSGSIEKSTKSLDFVCCNCVACSVCYEYFMTVTPVGSRRIVFFIGILS